MAAPPPPIAILFDIDGTLIDSGGAGRRAMEQAFVDMCGTASRCAFSFAGMTDRAIARQGLGEGAEGTNERALDKLIDRYLEHLEREMERPAGYRVLPGAVALVELAEVMGLALGLGTGNVRRGAEVKLRPAQIFDRFAFGGFGCDAEDRSQLIGIGIARACAMLNTQAVQTIVIGDTPKDIRAAHDNGARCLAVATGHHSTDALRQAGADLVVETLLDERAIALLSSAATGA